MNKILRSKRFGAFNLEVIGGDPLYTAQTEIGPYKSVDVTIHADNPIEAEFEEAIRKAEARVDGLVSSEQRIKREILPQVKSLIEAFTGNPWQGSDDILLRSMSMINLNYETDGSMVIYYHCEEPTEFHDVVVTLNKDMTIEEVGFDG